MSKFISLVLFMLFVIACSKVTYDTHDHSSEKAGKAGNEHDGEEIENIKFTVFSSHHELFAEMTPLIKEQAGQFTVHFTKIADFKPVTSGSLKIIISGTINETLSADSLTRTGIFIIPFTPKTTGNVDVIFIYTDGTLFDSIKIPNQHCYSSLEEAKKAQRTPEKGITFLKEESWKIDFAMKHVIPSDFSETVKATGKLINNPADEFIITANTSGVVEILDNSLTPGKKVSAGSRMFSIKPGSLREDNMELKYSQAKSNYERTKKEYERVSELYKSRISSEKEYIEVKSSFENAEAIFKNYSQSSEGKNITLKSPKSGYLKRLLVQEGQFVEAGTTLAIMANNNKLMIQVELPAKEYSKLGKNNNANFVIGNKTINIKELNGKFSGSPIISGSSGFITLFLQFENKIELLPNSYITVYLFGNNIPNSITIPKEALWEDQGNYFVFVQKNGELFEKREISIKGFDGNNYLIGNGLNNREVIVTKGAYRVMLASKSSELPANSHAH
ncbi:MAG: HlyD protein [Ignavibacteria bacterium]|nr:HlyD protein [Ignavibacteria bacterium]